jgi:hypothetical protein
MKIITHLNTTYRIEQDTECNEVHPDQMFETLQRIGHPTEQYDGIGHDLSRISKRYENQEAMSKLMWDARIMLDRIGAPSMSTGDTIQMQSDSGEEIVTWRCDPIGWTNMTTGLKL